MEKEKEKLKVTVETLPNGYALTVGREEYMYFNERDLLAGIWYHVGLEKLDYVSAENIELLLEAILSWPSIADAAEGQAKMMRDLKDARSSLYKYQRWLSEKEKICDKLRASNRDLEYRLKKANKHLEGSAEMAIRLDDALRSMDKLNLVNMRLEKKKDAQAQEIAALKRELAKYTKRAEEPKEAKDETPQNKVNKKRYVRTRKAADEMVLKELEKQEKEQNK